MARALHAGEQYGQYPDRAHQGEAGQHEQAVEQALAGQQDEQGERAEGAGGDEDEQQQAVQVGQDHRLLFLEQAVRDEAGEGELDQAGENQAARHQVGHRGLELRDEKVGNDDAGAEDTDEQDADDGEDPWPGADDAGVGVGLDQADQGVLAQQAAQFETDAGHQRASGQRAKAPA